MKRWLGKKGQFYLIAAIILATVIIGGNIIPNYSKEQNSGGLEELKLEFLSKLESVQDDSPYVNEGLEKIFNDYSSKIDSEEMVSLIENISGACHFMGHSLGKFIYDSSGSVFDAVKTCSNVCTSGCMHGAIETALTIEDGEHLTLEDVQAQVPGFCYSEKFVENNEVSSCAHAIGHAFSQVTSYDIVLSLENCQLFEDKTMAYYCGAGVYMDYGFDFEMGPGLYPCDVERYPSACFFYLTESWYVQELEDGGNLESMFGECEKLEGLHRLGCFYGLGSKGFELFINLGELCDQGNFSDKQMCIEGYMRYHGPWNSDLRSGDICLVLEEELKNKCVLSGTQDLYGLDRDWELYY